MAVRSHRQTLCSARHCQVSPALLPPGSIARAPGASVCVCVQAISQLLAEHLDSDSTLLFVSHCNEREKVLILWGAVWCISQWPALAAPQPGRTHALDPPAQAGQPRVFAGCTCWHPGCCNPCHCLRSRPACQPAIPPKQANPARRRCCSLSCCSFCCRRLRGLTGATAAPAPLVAGTINCRQPAKPWTLRSAIAMLQYRGSMQG